MAATETKRGKDSKGADAKPRRVTRATRVKATRAVAESYFEAVAALDPAAMAAHWHPDGVEDIDALGVFRGPAAVHELFAEMFAAFPDMAFTVDRILPDDGVACVQWRARGTFTGGRFQGIEPTGARLDIRGVDLVEVEDGKLTRNTAFYDGAGFARQLGLLPPEGSGPDRAMLAAFNGFTRARRAVASRTGGTP